MNKYAFYIFIFLLTVVSCQRDKEQSPDNKPVAIDIEPLPKYGVSRDTAVTALRNRRIASELEYYMKRHNVDDEGFDMVARYAEEGGAALSAYMPQGHINPLGVLHLRHLPRMGKGIGRDSCGRMVIGTWQADTLVSGIRIDTLGVYAGQFSKTMKADGHGSYRAADGSYYEGHWLDDLREGFGFNVSPENLLAGIWRGGRFLGEKVHYTSDRIYGIDISRYQHEAHRRSFPIVWRDLRISSLGHKANRPVLGEVDYPVRFVYIKSTEGISIRNRYYTTDYAAARKNKIHVGAYHFFRTRMSGRQQAHYFLNSTLLRKGDLPPVLDIEPSNSQIAKMGGAEALFHEIRQWIDVVERSTGTRPILYMNQRFIREHLDKAPDLKEKYLVWIARYGIYKPDVHLAIWQLSADGKVNGIKTDVDINVFNGYEGQWEEFLREECITK